ncbi:integrase [Mycobacterium nebraskense]|nr:integrase [Mycobacterium nebraskense]
MAGKSGRRGWGWVRQTSSGRYGASYVWPPELERHYSPTFATKMDAEHWLATERRLIDQDLWTPPKWRAAQRKATAITVSEYAATWIKNRNIKRSTQIEYERTKARHFDKTALGKVALKNLTPDVVRAWYASLGTEHKRRNSHAYALLHSVCATAVKDGLITVNPCQIERAMNPPRKREPAILSVPELATVADAIKPAQFRCLVLIAAWCGLRWGEVTELRRSDIDEACEIIVVARAVTHRGTREPGSPKGSGCRIDTPKSGQARAVVVPPHIRPDIKEHLAAYVGKKPDALVFPALRGGCHLNDSVFAKHFWPALKTVGRDGVKKPRPTIHDLRHFAGTQTARVANLSESMARLGHSTVRASLIYQGLVSGRDAEVAAALSELAKGAVT